MADQGSTRAAQGAQGGRVRRAQTVGRSAGLGGPNAVAGAPRTAGGNLAIGYALGGGAPLDDATRTEMQSRYGVDFTQVRVHAGAGAAQSADDMNANAYAVGHDIVFGPGRYAPHTHDGRRLLAHELAHVVQQSRGGPRPALDPTAPHERAADRAADAVMGGTGAVAVEGATGVGVAADWKAWLGEKYEGASELVDEAKELVPDEVKEVANDAIELAGDAKDLAVEYGPYAVGGPVLGNIVDFQRAAYTDIKESVTGVDDPEAKGLRETAAHKVDFAVGVGKGATSQLSDLADTVIWAGTEVRDAKDSSVKATAEAVGIDPETAKTISKWGSVLAAPIMPHALIADALGGANDALKDANWVDESGKASLTTKVQDAYDYVGDKALEYIDAPKKDNEDDFFTTREKGELVGAIGIQVAGAFVGATEAKVALAALGALSGVRGIVETMRAHPNDFYLQPSFVSALLGTVLSVAGIKGKGASKKIIDIAIKTGAVAQVGPHLWQLYNDYNDTALQADPERYHEVLEKDMGAVCRALVDIVLMIARNGVAGKKTPQHKGGSGGGPKDGGGSTKPPVGGTADTTAGNTQVPGADVTATGTGTGKGTAGTGASKPPSAAALKRADTRAQTAQQKAAKADTGAQKAEGSASTREAAAQKSKTLSDDQRARAEKNAQTLKNRQATAAEKQQALDDIQKTAASNGGDAKAKAKLDKQVSAAQRAADDAKVKAANAQKRADSERAKQQTDEGKAAAAEKRAQEARAAANEARARAKAAQKKAQEAKERAESLRPPPDPGQDFSDLNEPDSAVAPDARGLRPNPKGDPVAKLLTGKGPDRGTYVIEGDPRFAAEGPVMPLSQAKAQRIPQASPHDTPIAKKVPPAPQPIEQLRDASGRPVESAGAGGPKGSSFLSATAKAAKAVNETSIPPDIDENQVYNQRVLKAREVGLLRPQGSNVPGADCVTAKVTYDSKGRPRVKVYLNDVTTLGADKGPKASHAQWLRDLKASLDPKAPPGQRLDLGDPKLEAAIRQAVADGEVYVRVIRTETTAKGSRTINIDPGETWRVEPIAVPKLPNLVEPDEEEKQGETP